MACDALTRAAAKTKRQKLQMKRIVYKLVDMEVGQIIFAFCLLVFAFCLGA